jgi:hypothetical protein
MKRHMLRLFWALLGALVAVGPGCLSPVASPSQVAPSATASPAVSSSNANNANASPVTTVNVATSTPADPQKPSGVP